MTPTEIAKLQQENQILKQALQDSIDYHHHIGNRDCPYSRNQIMVTLYKIAEEGLKNAQKVTEQPVLNPIDTNGLFEAIGTICREYNEQIIKAKQ